MAVYSIKNLHSEELNDRIALVESYYDVMHTDYSLIREQVINEATIADIGKFLASAVVKIVGKVVQVLLQLGNACMKATGVILKKLSDGTLNPQINSFLERSKSGLFIPKELGVRKVNTMPDCSFESAEKETMRFINDDLKKMVSEVEELASNQENITKESLDNCIEDMKEKVKAVQQNIKDLMTDYIPSNVFYESQEIKDFRLFSGEAKFVVKALTHPKMTYNDVKEHYDIVKKQFNDYKKQSDSIAAFLSKNKDATVIRPAVEELSTCYVEIVSETSKFETNICKQLTSAYIGWLNDLYTIVRYKPKAGDDLNPHWALLDEYIDDKDIRDIRNTLSYVYTRERTYNDFAQAIKKDIKYVESKGIDIMEKFDPSIEPLVYGSKPNSELTRDDLHEISVYLSINFCRERIEDMYKVLKVVGDK